MKRKKHYTAAILFSRDVIDAMDAYAAQAHTLPEDMKPADRPVAPMDKPVSDGVFIDSTGTKVTVTLIPPEQPGKSPIMQVSLKNEKTSITTSEKYLQRLSSFYMDGDEYMVHVREKTIPDGSAT